MPSTSMVLQLSAPPPEEKKEEERRPAEAGLRSLPHLSGCAHQICDMVAGVPQAVIVQVSIALRCDRVAVTKDAGNFVQTGNTHEIRCMRVSQVV